MEPKHGKDVMLDYSRSDAFALGMLLYEMMCTTKAFSDVQRRQLNPLPSAEYAAELIALTQSLLHYNPSQRPSLSDAIAVLCRLAQVPFRCMSCGHLHISLSDS